MLVETLERVEHEMGEMAIEESRSEQDANKPACTVRGLLWKQSGGKQSAGSRLSFGNLTQKWDKARARQSRCFSRTLSPLHFSRVQRYFVLEAGSTMLFYYKSEQEASDPTQMSGQLDLNGCKVATSSPQPLLRHVTPLWFHA